MSTNLVFTNAMFTNPMFTSPGDYKACWTDYRTNPKLILSGTRELAILSCRAQSLL